MCSFLENAMGIISNLPHGRNLWTDSGTIERGQFKVSVGDDHSMWIITEHVDKWHMLSW